MLVTNTNKYWWLQVLFNAMTFEERRSNLIHSSSSLHFSLHFIQRGKRKTKKKKVNNYDYQARSNGNSNFHLGPIQHVLSKWRCVLCLIIGRVQNRINRVLEHQGSWADTTCGVLLLLIHTVDVDKDVSTSDSQPRAVTADDRSIQIQ